MGFVEQLRKADSELYWFAVDLASDGRSARYIVQQLYWRIEAANEKRAVQGLPLLAVDLPVAV